MVKGHVPQLGLGAGAGSGSTQTFEINRSTDRKEKGSSIESQLNILLPQSSSKVIKRIEEQTNRHEDAVLVWFHCTPCPRKFFLLKAALHPLDWWDAPALGGVLPKRRYRTRRLPPVGEQPHLSL